MTAAAALMAGCGSSDSPATGDDEQQIEAVLGELREAQESGDAELACSEVYVIREAERPGAEGTAEGEPEGEGEGEEVESGGDCEETFREADERRRAEVSDLSTEIGEIEVDDESATATVHTTLTRLDGSVLEQDVPYDLVRTPEGWRVRIADEG